jgi:hypothetical protein
VEQLKTLHDLRVMMAKILVDWDSSLVAYQGAFKTTLEEEEKY